MEVTLRARHYGVFGFVVMLVLNASLLAWSGHRQADSSLFYAAFTANVLQVKDSAVAPNNANLAAQPAALVLPTVASQAGMSFVGESLR